jgi:hypothetical protein
MNRNLKHSNFWEYMEYVCETVEGNGAWFLEDCTYVEPSHVFVGYVCRGRQEGRKKALFAVVKDIHRFPRLIIFLDFLRAPFIMGGFAVGAIAFLAQYDPSHN